VSVSDQTRDAAPAGEETTRRRSGIREGVVYKIGFAILGTITFFCLWTYAVATYGWFLGLGLGWIPAFFIAALVGSLWPLWVAILAIPLWVASLAIVVLRSPAAAPGSTSRWRWPRSREPHGPHHLHAERREVR
jgi:hypothetical protein